MKIVQVHNRYQQAGGEDIVVAEEKKLLEKNGHTVLTYFQNNNDIKQYSSIKKVKLFSQLHFNPRSYKNCLAYLKKHQPDVCHVHNTLHIISPAIFKACKDTNTPVVQTLHNYRPICVNGMLTKNNIPCESCLGKSAYHSLKDKCYRNSYLQTFAVARLIEKNKQRRLYQDNIDAFICFTDFAKDKFIIQGIPAEKIHVKPNFLNETAVEQKSTEPYLVFVGRLEEAKGAHILNRVAKKISLPIYVIGEGKLSVDLQEHQHVKMLGQLPHKTTLKYIQGADALFLPSTVYEGMPLTILEAFAHRTPVIASNIGAMASMVRHEDNGLLFEVNDIGDAVNKINQLFSNQTLKNHVAQNGFQDFVTLYSAKVNYNKLMAIYQSILKS